MQPSAKAADDTARVSGAAVQAQCMTGSGTLHTQTLYCCVKQYDERDYSFRVRLCTSLDPEPLREDGHAQDGVRVDHHDELLIRLRLLRHPPACPRVMYHPHSAHLSMFFSSHMAKGLPGFRHNQEHGTSGKAGSIGACKARGRQQASPRAAMRRAAAHPQPGGDSAGLVVGRVVVV